MNHSMKMNHGTIYHGGPNGTMFIILEHVPFVRRFDVLKSAQLGPPCEPIFPSFLFFIGVTFIFYPNVSHDNIY